MTTFTIAIGNDMLLATVPDGGDIETAARVAAAAWETWTKNGLGLDADDREQTAKAVNDATNNAWLYDMDESAWLAATLSRLGWRANEMPAAWRAPCEDEATLDLQDAAAEREFWRREEEAEWLDAMAEEAGQ